MPSGRDRPRCMGEHREGECGGCLWERECRYVRWVRTGRGGPRDDRGGRK